MFTWIIDWHELSEWLLMFCEWDKREVNWAKFLIKIEYLAYFMNTFSHKLNDFNLVCQHI